MSHEWERGYNSGYDAGMAAMIREQLRQQGEPALAQVLSRSGAYESKPKRKRKLSDWQKYVKVNSKKPRFKFKSGSKKGRVNFKALGVAFRKTPSGKKKRR